MYPDARHPINVYRKRDWNGWVKHLTRTQRPVKYYIIDFSLSQQYPPDEPRRAVDHPGFGGDRTVPEFKTGDLCNSFAVDVYCLGNTFRELTYVSPRFLAQNTPALRDFCAQPSMFGPGKKGLGFLLPLIQEMVQDDPNLRPTIDEVAEKFARIRSRLHWWTLRARVAEKDEEVVLGFFCSVIHWTRQGLSFGR